MQGPDQVSMQLDSEVQRLHHEVEALRLKDLQQEHHIHILTQQLRGSHPDPHQADTQEQAEPPALPSSVTAKWQEWRQHRSLSPERFRSQAIRPIPGDISKALSPPLRQRRSVIKDALQGLPSRSAQPCPSSQPADSHMAHGTHPARRSGSKPTHKHHEAAQLQTIPQQSHYQISAAMGASGKAGRSKGTFGLEHRWYQPTQAAGKAAALTHAALAAAAAEQERLENGHWLLKSAADGRSRSAQRCTFGGELRWWESPDPGRSPHTAQAGPHHHQHQAMLVPLGFAHAREPSHKLEGPPAVQAGSPDQKDSMLQSRSAHEVQWRGNAAAGQSLMQSASAAAAASASQVGSAHGTDHSRQQSFPADSFLRQAQPVVSAEQASWKSDRDPSPDSTLMRVQQKHARIQSLAAIIKQRPTSARTHTVKSTFGFEARWWEKSSAYEDASASGCSPDQQREDSSRVSSPDRSHRMQLMSRDTSAHVTSAHDAHGVSKGQSTFGLEARWWEPKRLTAPTAVAVQDTAVGQTRVLADRGPPLSASRVPRADRGAADSWWGRSQQCQVPLPPHAPLPYAGPHSSSMSLDTQSPSQPQASQPGNISTSIQQQSSQRLHAQPWAASSPLPTQAGSQWPECTGDSWVSGAPNRTPMRGSRSSRATPTRQSRGSITPVATPMRQSRGSISPSRRSSVSVRQSRDWGRAREGRSSSEGSRSASPERWGKGGRQLNRIPSSRPELQNELRHRSAERQRLEQVVAPHPTDWAQGLREGTRTFQRQDSRAEARALQLEFLQKAKEDLETFQRNCAAAASAHGLPASDKPGSSSRHSIEAAPCLGEQEEKGPPHNRHADSGAIAANGAANRCARKWLRAAKQAQYAQAPGQGRVQQASAPAPRLSHQSSASKAAMQVQQQQLAAEEAEQRLMAFCQATEGSSAEASRQHQHEAEATGKAASAAPVMCGYSAQQVIQQPQPKKQQAASGSSVAAPKKLMTHSSLPSTYAAASTPEAVAGSNIVRSVSWAQQLELQEPPHDDSYDSPHMHAHMSHGLPPTVPGTAALRPTLHVAGGGDGTVRSASAVNVDSNQSQREALTEYYKAKQAAATLLSQQAAAPAAPASVTDAVLHESASASPPTAPLNSHAASASSLVSQSSSASVNRSAAEDIVGPPASRMSLLMAQARYQVRADALTPGKPGLQSQLSQMMEEVAQARSEVQEVQSQLSVHSRLGLRSGSMASSFDEQ